MPRNLATCLSPTCAVPAQEKSARGGHAWGITIGRVRHMSLQESRSFVSFLCFYFGLSHGRAARNCTLILLGAAAPYTPDLDWLSRGILMSATTVAATSARGQIILPVTLLQIPSKLQLAGRSTWLAADACLFPWLRDVGKTHQVIGVLQYI